MSPRSPRSAHTVGKTKFEKGGHSLTVKPPRCHRDIRVNMEEHSCSNASEKPLRILEFYSGIGGMVGAIPLFCFKPCVGADFLSHQHYGLLGSQLNGEIVGAWDINTNANEVYYHNFNKKPSGVRCIPSHAHRRLCNSRYVSFQSTLERISAATLDSFEPDVFLMSPPCQPYTRAGMYTHYSACLQCFDQLFTLFHWHLQVCSGILRINVHCLSRTFSETCCPT